MRGQARLIASTLNSSVKVIAAPWAIARRRKGESVYPASGASSSDPAGKGSREPDSGIVTQSENHALCGHVQAGKGLFHNIPMLQRLIENIGNFRVIV